MRALIVEDDPDLSAQLAAAMRDAGFVTDCARDGVQGEYLGATECYDVAILDLGLPGMDGHEVARRLRGRPESERALIVALTGWGQESDRKRSSEAGFDRHLVKPVDPEALRGLLERAESD